MSLVAISWSKQQGVLHREDLSDMLETNQAMLRGELEPNDYLLVWIGAEEASSKALAELQPLALGYRAIDAARGGGD